MSASLLERAAKLDAAGLLAALSARDKRALKYSWPCIARPEQLAPAGDWRTWLVISGRGFGKTRLGAEWVRSIAEHDPAARIALVAPTAADARDVIVEGESGIMAVCPPWARPIYEPSKRRITWASGAIATTYSAEEADRLRGPQHSHAWGDELATWQYAEDTWNMLQLGLRLGERPRTLVTTTPRPLAIIRELLASPATAVVRGSTYDNAANLPDTFLEAIRARYEGTRIGRQEIHAEILDDVPGALWKRSELDALRVRHDPHREYARVVVAIDPAVTSTEGSDETGIIVAAKGVDGHGYVLADLSCRMSPDGWARRAVDAYRTYRADRIVAEVNNGGDLVELVIRTVDPRCSFKAVHASRGKMTRAEPVAALYEQARCHHIGGFPQLEDQMCLYTPEGYDGSPDRVDALVWAFSELMLREPVTLGAGPIVCGSRRAEGMSSDDDDERGRW